MIKANELRIGNYIGRGIVTRIMDYMVTTKTGKGEWTEKYELSQPIPLTEDWLLSFGFTRGEEYETGAVYYNYDFDDKRYHVRMYNGKAAFDIDWFITCEYVHQLQNLYFALTGEELRLQE